MRHTAENPTRKSGTHEKSEKSRKRFSINSAVWLEKLVYEEIGKAMIPPLPICHDHLCFSLTVRPNARKGCIHDRDTIPRCAEAWFPWPSEDASNKIGMMTQVRLCQIEYSVWPMGPIVCHEKDNADVRLPVPSVRGTLFFCFARLTKSMWAEMLDDVCSSSQKHDPVE